MLDFIKKLFRFGSQENDDADDEHKEEQQSQDTEEITVHSCEVIDIEVIDDELH